MFDIAADEGWLTLGLLSSLESSLSGKDEYTESAGIVSHSDICVDTVSYHSNLRRLKIHSCADTAEHPEKSCFRWIKYT